MLFMIIIMILWTIKIKSFGSVVMDSFNLRDGRLLCGCSNEKLLSRNEFSVDFPYISTSPFHNLWASVFDVRPPSLLPAALDLPPPLIHPLTYTHFFRLG